jgi:D-3-phosphoglycerate dehydrogenase
MTRHVLVADRIAAEGLAFLEQQDDLFVEVRTGLDEETLCAAVADVEALVVRSATRVTPRVLAAAPRLVVIGRAGIGVDNIDVPEATARGVVVLNTPDANATTTAELTIAHLLSLSRNLPRADRSVREGGWERAQLTGTEVAGKVLGVVGFGTIGRLVAARARALGMELLVHDPFVAAEIVASAGGRPVALDELLGASDYVTLHTPVTTETRGLIDAERLAAMKDGARLINCARGALVREDALAAALASGKLAGAAIDVFAAEPPTGSPLLAAPNVVFTPHLGASTREAQAAVGLQIARQVAAFLATGEAVHAVNLPPVSPEELARLRPWLALARRLGRLLGALAPAPCEEVVVTLGRGPAGVAPSQVTVAALVGLLADRFDVPVNQVNAAQLAAGQGIKVVEATTGDAAGYRSLLEVAGRAADRTVSVAGTLFDERHPRLVRIDDHEIEAVLEGELVITRHEDRPGVVADVGRVLADAGLNIVRMHLGPVGNRGEAVAVIGLDRAAGEPVRAAIGDLDAVLAVRCLSMTGSL